MMVCFYSAYLGGGGDGRVKFGFVSGSQIMFFVLVNFLHRSKTMN
jgi:hypothetical protein